MGFYRTELERFKIAVAARDIDSFWIMSSENSRNMRIVYTRLNNIQDYIQWLEYMADMEDNNNSAGSVLISVGGV